jgi:hypothetical protein
MKYIAMYMPSREIEDIWFDSEIEAENYVLNRMCLACKQARAEALKYKKLGYEGYEEYASEWPACASEWEILSSEEYYNL